MDPLTLALLAGGSSLVGGLPDIIPSKYEREQKKELKDLQRQQELGMLGLSERERNVLQNAYQPQISQQQAYADAERARLAGMSAQPGAQALAMQAAGDRSLQLQSQVAQQVAMADLQKKAEQEQQIRDLKAAQAEYAKKRQEALVGAVTQGVEGFIGGQNLAALTGTAKPGLMEQRQIKQAQQAADLAAQTAKNDAMVAQALAVSRMQQEWGLTQQQAEEFYKSSDWSAMDPNVQAYYTRIK